MSNLTMIQQGVFTADGASKRIDLPGGANYFKILNQTEAAATNDVAFQFEWWDNLADDEAYAVNKTGGGNGLQADMITTDGLTYRASYPSPEAQKVGAGITKADPAVCTSTSHGYKVGNRVRIYNNAVMSQIAGMSFTITAADANTFTLGYLDSSAFSNVETSFNCRRLAPELEVLPGARFVTAISAAAQAVVEVSEAHEYKVGDVLYFRLPAVFGMVEIDGLQAKVTAVTAGGFTLDLDTSAFTAYAFPDEPAVAFDYAIVGPAGKRGLYDDWFSASRSLLDLDPFRQGLQVPYMFLPGGSGNPAGAASDVIVWQAYRQSN